MDQQLEFTQDSIKVMEAVASASIEKIFAGESIESVTLYFIDRCKSEQIPMDQLLNRPIGDIISGGLRELDIYLALVEIFVAGPTNAGKDLFLKLLFHVGVVAQMKKVLLPDASEVVPLLDDEDVADKTKFLTRLPLSESEGGIVLVNSPGFYNDDPEEGLEDMTRAVLGMPTFTEVKHIPLVDAGELPIEPESLPVEEIPNRFCAHKRVVIYLLDLSMTPLGRPLQDSIRSDLQTLRDIYGDRLIVCGSHSDVLNNWDERSRAKRRAAWQRVLGQELHMIEYSGIDENRKGVLAILRAILTAAGEDPQILLPCLQTDLKQARLTYSLHQLAGLLTSVLNNVSQDQPYSHLRAGITLACSLYCSIYYGVTEEEYLHSDGKIEKILTIAKDGITSEVESRERSARGWREKLSKWWSGKQFYENVQVHDIGASAIAESCALIYSLIHTLEEIPSPLVSETEAERFLVAYFSKCEAQALLKEKDSQALQRAIAQGLIAFFQEYHPQVLEFRAKLRS